ncbi:HET-domain-containing protein [Trametes cingulata]|nr:HET-domain-containing protein [Trametes cingulata]
MWLLSTDRAELHFFAGPEAVPEGGYAILSHVWVTGEEQTFQDLQAIRQTCAQTGENPRDLVCAKIRECCILAERHGFGWVWIDTCCIDKTSSSELSEAINAMFRYYTLAEVCYVYLRDVPSDCVLKEPDSAFRKSRWHTRGWTLQELLAPALVLFMSSEWKLLGTKTELAPLLQEITGIDCDVLLLLKSLETVGVARRMSWAAYRHTTRLEDEAYCLLGIFGISMPTLYGEGRRAFRRLQEEIIKNSIDTSIFAWGLCKAPGRLSETPPFPLSKLQRSSVASGFNDSTFLLAPSPSEFRRGRFIYYIPRIEKQYDYIQRMKKTNTCKGTESTPPSGSDTPPDVSPAPQGSKDVGVPRFHLTSYGMQAHIPIIEARGLTIAVLFCFRNGQQLGLLLHPCEQSVDPTRPLYHTSYAFDAKQAPCGCSLPSGFMDTYRLIPIGGTFHDLRLDDQPVTAEWRDIYLELQPTQIGRHVVINRSLDSPFRVPQWLIMKLRTTWGFELYTTGPKLKPEIKLKSAVIDFRHVNGEAFGVWMGSCNAALNSEQSMSSCSDPDSESSVVHLSGRHNSSWAFAFLVEYGVPRPPGEHRCPEDHVTSWPDGTRTFGDDRRSIQMAFRPCRMNPTGSVVMDIDLGGWVFTKLKESQTTLEPLASGLRFLPIDQSRSNGGNPVDAGSESSTTSGPCHVHGGARVRATSGGTDVQVQEGTASMLTATLEDTIPHTSEAPAVARPSTTPEPAHGWPSPPNLRRSRSLEVAPVSEPRPGTDADISCVQRRNTLYATPPGPPSHPSSSWATLPAAPVLHGSNLKQGKGVLR